MKTHVIQSVLRHVKSPTRVVIVPEDLDELTSVVFPGLSEQWSQLGGGESFFSSLTHDCRGVNEEVMYLS